VFATNVLVCDTCDGAMRILAILPKGDASRSLLAHLGLPTRWARLLRVTFQTGLGTSSVQLPEMTVEPTGHTALRPTIRTKGCTHHARGKFAAERRARRDAS
jgi:hypothetical protein